MLMDLTDELDQSDSGMESLTASKDDTPERKTDDSLQISPISTTADPSSPLNQIATQPFNLKEYDDEPDESLAERLWGLTEMFPDWLRNGTQTVSSKSWSGVKNLYGLSRNVVWIIASSSVIMFAPVIFEVERAQVEEMQKSQQKQVLLGTNTMTNMPPMPR